MGGVVDDAHKGVKDEGDDEDESGYEGWGWDVRGREGGGEGEGLEGGKGNYRWRGAWPRTEGIDWMRERDGILDQSLLGLGSGPKAHWG